ncbi:MAG: TIGR02147 family protein [Bdellovibrionales bacterium]
MNRTQLKSTDRSHQSIGQLPVLAEFTDYREYLQAFYDCRRHQTRGDLRPYSYAHFSAAANIKSPNYLKMVIQKKRNLSAAMIDKFSKAMNLNKKSSEEFRALVNYNQATEPLERNRCLKILSDLRVKSSIEEGNLTQEDFDRVPSWVSWALVALTDAGVTDFDEEKIFETLKGRAKKDEIRKCLQKLISEGQLEEVEGEIRKTGRQMKDADKIPSELVKKLQAQLIYLGLESLFNDEASDREFGTITLSLTEAEYDKLKFDVRHFRKKVYAEALLHREQNGPGDKVYQLNFQLFPLSK